MSPITEILLFIIVSSRREVPRVEHRHIEYRSIDWTVVQEIQYLLGVVGSKAVLIAYFSACLERIELCLGGWGRLAVLTSAS